MACRESLALGAYLLGVLESEECSTVERHVARCAQCHAQLMELAPLVGLMEQVPFEEPGQLAQTGPTTNVPAAAPEPVGTAQAVSRSVRRARVRRLLIAGALAVAAAVTGFGVYLSTQSSQPAAVPSAVTVSVTDPTTHVTASAALAPAVTGTSIRLRLSGLPPAVCRLVVHARDGHTETAATWTSGYETAVSVPGSSALGVRDIARMDVVTSSGRLLVELRPR
ncbi:anti-sigma factor family protein [Streptomyces guryensis]|uniref:Zf-HC2 domain-containing protein n=1 Tax=Streptomyces guryensis TaxID=2886947 RepID=A0A9Q3VJ67_9ACTN|nr:zf-HC2 domain-containing protein [Streptomyces guryensis]MCD9872539.1 zf-HC2 domain-containing protein [Streptomyces guryensis]